MRNFGYIHSKLTADDHIFEDKFSKDMPSSFSYVKYMSPILDQGDAPICVPCSVSAFINWKLNSKTGNPDDHNVKLLQIYNSKTNEGDGMMLKDAFHFLKHTGVGTNEGNVKISSYAFVKNAELLKCALFTNGPCVGALPVYDNGEPLAFWRRGGELLGGHAISIVGYTPAGFVIRNSWGTFYGKNGYVFIPIEDFGCFYEAWTVSG